MQHSISSSDIALPRKLKRPMFVFFRRVSAVLLVALAFCAVTHNSIALMLTLMFGGSLWFVLAFVLLCNWQVVTLCDEHLEIVRFGRKSSARYVDIRSVQAERGERGVDGPISVATLLVHRKASCAPLKINLENLADSERAILIQTIQNRSPQAQLNAYAKEIRSSSAR